MRLRLLICALIVTSSLAAEEYAWWVEPCTAALEKSTNCRASDPELAKWALEAWQRESNNAITFRPVATEEQARIRIRWAGGASGLYGETEPISVNGKRGANVYVLPDLRALGNDIAATADRDPLFREAIVYLTCLHESGHAIGLAHTASYPDIMFSFGYGGDIVEYFQRYRRLLKTREEIRNHSGISPADRTALNRLWRTP